MTANPDNGSADMSINFLNNDGSLGFRMVKVRNLPRIARINVARAHARAKVSQSVDF